MPNQTSTKCIQERLSRIENIKRKLRNISKAGLPRRSKVRTQVKALNEAASMTPREVNLA